MSKRQKTLNYLINVTSRRVSAIRTSVVIVVLYFKYKPLDKGRNQLYLRSSILLSAS